jgi:hypothetical protein
MSKDKDKEVEVKVEEKGESYSKLRGFSTLLVDADPFVINERTYQFAKLGVGGTFKIINIVKNALTYGYGEASLIIKNLKNVQNSANLAWVIAPLMGIPECEVLLIDFLETSLREVYRDDENKPQFRGVVLQDAEVFPMGSELVIMANLAAHPEIGSFFTTFKALKDHPTVEKVANFLKTLSTPTGKTP